MSFRIFSEFHSKRHFVATAYGKLKLLFFAIDSNAIGILPFASTSGRNF